MPNGILEVKQIKQLSADGGDTVVDVENKTIDGVAIGGATPAAGSFTSVDATSASLDGAVTINESGADVDFRVESDTNENALFVDGSSGNVGIGTSSPQAGLQVAGTFPSLGLQETDQGTDKKNWDFTVNGNLFRLRAVNDSYSAGVNAFSVDRGTGTAIDNISFYTGAGTERMRIDSSGNVGVGASTVVAPFHVGTEGDQGITAWFGDDSSFVNAAGYHYSDARVGISGRDSDTTDRGAGVEFTCRNTAGSNWLHGYIVHNRDGAFTFGTGGVGSSSSTEAMRINSDKQVLIGTTSSLGTNGERLAIEHTFPVSGMTLNQTTSGTTYATEYRNQNNLVGFVRCSTTATTFGTSSDYRLKKDVQPMSGSIDRLKALKPVNFAWKIDGSRVDGFLAHEAQEIVPEAVSGEKDAVDANGNPEYQGVDYGRITPLLTSALQDAIEKIEILERRIAELEAR